MAEQKYGVDTIKQYIDTILGAVGTVKTALKDGFQPLQDGLAIIPITLQLPSLLAKRQDFENEINEYSPEEREEINTYFRTKWNFTTNEQLSKAIADAFAWVNATYVLVDDIIELKKVPSDNANTGSQA